ncbi:Ig-like domain-containing protein, partial [Magnetococcales bacterium HHB-1]
LTLSGTASVSDYQAALRSVKYQNTNDNPSTQTRTVSFDVTDNTGHTSTAITSSVDVIAINDAPVALNNTIYATEDVAYQITVDDLGYDDAEGTLLDKIRFTELESVGSLKLNGVDVTVDQAIYLSDINAGNLTYTSALNGSGINYDSMQFKVSDGNSYGLGTYTLTVDVANALAPVLSNSTGDGSLIYTENDSSTDINPALEITDSDSANLTGAIVTIQNYVDGEDTLGFSDQNGITGSWDSTNGVMTLSGTTTVANYQTALRSVTYVNSSENPSTTSRLIDFAVTDSESNVSGSLTSEVTITAVNDLPTASNSTITALEDISYALTVSDFSFSDLDGESLASVRISQLETVGSLKLNGADVTLDQVISVSDIVAGNLTYVSALDGFGTGYDSFQFEVSDGTVYS